MSSFIKRIFKKEIPRESLDAYLGYMYFLRNGVEKGEVDRETQKENVVWQMWWQGVETAPEIAKLCMKSVQQNCPEGYEYRLITRENVEKYIEIPEYIVKKINSGVTITHLSDYIRASLLSKYGGMWIDSTCFMRGGVPDDIKASDIFYFQSPIWIDNKVEMTSLSLRQYLRTPLFVPCIASGSSWFISCKGYSHIMSSVKRNLERYWQVEDRLNDYFLFHHLITYLILHDDECRDEFYNMPKVSNVPPHLMQFSLFESADNYESLIEQSFIHKLTYKIKRKVTRGSVIERLMIEY